MRPVRRPRALLARPRQRFEADVRERLTRALVAYPGVYLSSLRFEGGDEINPMARVTCVVTSPYSLGPDKVKTLQATLPRAGDGGEIDLHIRSILTSETTVKGYVHQLPEAKAQAQAAQAQAAQAQAAQAQAAQAQAAQAQAAQAQAAQAQAAQAQAAQAQAAQAQAAQAQAAQAQAAQAQAAQAQAAQASASD